MNPLKKLILIDDDEIIVFLTKKIITNNNIIELTNIFRNGKEAIDFIKINSNNFDLLPEIIFLDLFMPIMDGWQFLDEFKKIKSQLVKPIIIYVITSSIFPEDMIRVKNYPEVSGYITKPFNKDHFIELIQKI